MCKLRDDFARKTTTADRKTQVSEKTNIPCLCRSDASGIYLGIFTRGTVQVKKSLKTNDKELARRRLESLRQKRSRLNTKAGREIMFVDMANRWLESVGESSEPSSRLAEATETRWGDVNFELKNFTSTGGERGTKNHEARTVPLFPALESFLITMRSALAQPPKPTDLLFAIQTAKKAIATSCRKAAVNHGPQVGQP
jgi:hypothetical protein